MSHIIKVIDGLLFIPKKELSILEALESQKVQAEYQCRQGFCGLCQVKLLDGEVEYTMEPIAYTNESNILPCCCKPASDIVIQLPQGCEFLN
jgi:ferredoxin